VLQVENFSRAIIAVTTTDPLAIQSPTLYHVPARTCSVVGCSPNKLSFKMMGGGKLTLTTHYCLNILWKFGWE